MMAKISVRYIIDDVTAAIAFYTTHLGFSLVAHPAPDFAILSQGELRLLVNASSDLAVPHNPCRMAANRSRVAGSGSRSRCPTSKRKFSLCVRQERIFGTIHWGQAGSP